METKKEEVKPIETNNNKVVNSPSSSSSKGALTASTNTNYNNPSNDKFIEKIEKEINAQKLTFTRQFTQIQEELSKVRASISQTPNDNSLLVKQFQVFNDALIEMGKKISALQEENTNLKKNQIDLLENISNLQKEMKKKEEADDDDNSFKTLYDNIYEQSEKMRTKINKLSDENYSIGNKINEIKSSSENKDEKIKEITEENYDLKNKVKNLENEVSEWRRKFESNMENAQRENSRNERNEAQISRLNTEISQLKESLDKMISKNEEKKSIFDGIDETKIKYGIFFIICLVAIYFIYRKCFKNDEASNEVPHMKLSQQYGSYGGYSNSLM
jgi:chromosome segregation ATPase